MDTSVHQKRFLECFVGSGGRILTAARWAKLHRNCHYNWLKEDPTYLGRFQEAERKAARVLQDEATRRAYEGVRRAVYHHGKIVGYEHEYSDSLLLALLKGTQPDKFRDRAAIEHTGAGGEKLNIIVTRSDK